MKLRPELVRLPCPDGGLHLYDPLLEQLIRLTPEDAAALERGAPSPPLAARLRGGMLEEGPAAVALRERIIAARLRTAYDLGAPPPPLAPVDWSIAETLPEQVSPLWRSASAWRALAEDRRAGRKRLSLRCFAPSMALLQAARALPYARLDTALVHAERAPLTEGPLWELLTHPALRVLIGGALGLALPERAVMNAWRLGPGDHMGPHPDGRRYKATFSLGLCPDWRAEDGGAISFGEPGLIEGEPTFTAEERFLPQLGELLIFAPGPETWHLVEPVREGVRYTVTGWWVEG